jgi:hypothetical protein
MECAPTKTVRPVMRFFGTFPATTSFSETTQNSPLFEHGAFPTIWPVGVAGAEA